MKIDFEGGSIDGFLFKNVTQVPLERSGFLNAAHLTSLAQLRIALTLAHSSSQSIRSVSSQILYNLSPTTSMEQSISYMGIDDKTRHLIYLSPSISPLELSELEKRIGVPGEDIDLKDIVSQDDIQNAFKTGPIDWESLLKIVSGTLAIKHL